mmetsp:Transcript_19529/g.22630  ORF Transcript_19529/g.22630 Transcript_19529/m.22630 type:complete len:310 (-) Transcript_19529:187-1116(-)
MIYSTILALCALQGVQGFTIQPPKSSGSALMAESYSNYVGTMNDVRPDIASVASTGTMTRQSSDIGTRLSTMKPKSTKEVFERINCVKVQGTSLKTCSFNENVERVEVLLKTEGRPLNANVELWQGPDNSPQKISVYLEDGSKRPFRATIECPGSSNSVAIRNTGQVEFPLTAGIDPDINNNNKSPASILSERSSSRIVQGGAVYTTPFSPAVQSVQICLKTDGRPMNVRVELLQGPNNNKQVLEVYSEDGRDRPFFAIIETPGSGNVVRIVNTATVEFPLNASIEPYIVDDSIKDSSNNDDGTGMTWS